MAKRLVDNGEPGKYYFEAPITANIALEPKINLPKRKIAEPVYLDPRDEPVNLVNWRERTNCRLLSCRNAALNTCPKDIGYLLTPHPSLSEVKDYLELKELEGFGVGAIVARKWLEKGKFRWSQTWGTVQLVHGVPRGTNAIYHPYTIKWHMLGEIEQAWAEDLIVIHAALNEATLDTIAEAQGVEV